MTGLMVRFNCPFYNTKHQLRVLYTGQSAAKSLATSSPDKAVDNADSHEYFAENTPALS